MPGYELRLRCPCGFAKKEVGVGVSEDGTHYGFCLCLECRQVVERSATGGRAFSAHCTKCGSKLVGMDEEGAWGPYSLQKKFPGRVPWLLDENRITSDDLLDKENIRILCPRCRKYSLEFEITTYWD